MKRPICAYGKNFERSFVSVFTGCNYRVAFRLLSRVLTTNPIAPLHPHSLPISHPPAKTYSVLWFLLFREGEGGQLPPRPNSVLHSRFLLTSVKPNLRWAAASSSLLCTLSCTLCTLSCTLCTLSCTLCTLSCTLCTLSCTLCTLSCILCTLSTINTFKLFLSFFFPSQNKRNKGGKTSCLYSSLKFLNFGPILLFILFWFLNFHLGFFFFFFFLIYFLSLSPSGVDWVVVCIYLYK